MSGKHTLRFVLSIDVEEEGLFSGKYDRRAKGVSNVAELERIGFVSKEFGLPLTLLTSYPVANDAGARDMLKRWRDEHGAEIGAHLHHWNTPPLEKLPVPEPAPCEQVPPALLRAKMETLTAKLEKEFGQAPLSFRMGRFDFGEPIRRLLPELGIRVDSSIVPMHHRDNVPYSFTSKVDPYVLDPGANTRLVEVPLTIVSAVPGVPGVAQGLGRVLPRGGAKRLKGFARSVAAAGIHPVWYPQSSMRWAVTRHVGSGGRVLNMFLHSSELLPGAYPNLPDEAAVQGVTRKLHSFLQWLTRKYTVKGATLGDFQDLS